MSHIGRCGFCGEAVFKLSLRTGPSGLNDIDWRPWTLDEEVQPTHDENGKELSAATIRRWKEERPYRLGLVVINLAAGTYEDATNKPRGKLRSNVMHRRHWCNEKEAVLYGTKSNSRI